MMTDAEILQAYDHDERWRSTAPGFRREETPLTVRHVPLGEGEGFVLASSLDETSAGAAIEAEVARFGGAPFEWKLFAHDRPPDLRARLEAAGFVVGEEERLCVLDLRAPLPEPPAPPILLLEDPADLGPLRRVREEVWGDEGRVHTDQLAGEIRAVGDRLRVYVALHDGEPAAAAWLRLPEESRFASLWGGATRPAFRGRGLYRALVDVRAREARRRGYRWLTIDAGPMSLPIVRRMGFRPLSTTWPTRYRPPAKAARS